MNSKLFEALSTLKKNQLKKLQFFLKFSNPSIKQREKTICNSLILNFQKKNPVSEEAFKERFLKEETNGEWKRIKNRFLKIVEQYLALSLLQEDDFLSDYLLLKYYQVHGAKKNYNALRVEKAKHLKTQSNPVFRNLYVYLLNELQLQGNKSDRRTNKTSADEYLPLAKQSLDKFYFLQYLRMSCASLNRKNVLKQEVEIEELPFDKKKINEFIEEELEINLYYQVFLFLKNSEDNNHKELKGLIEKLKDKKILQKKILKEAIDYLTNYYIQKINEGCEEYSNDYLEAMFFLEQHDLLLDNKQLDAAHFSNYVTVTLLSENYEKAKTFIQTYEKKLKFGLHREGIVVLTKAKLSFHLGDIQATWNYLQNFKPADFRYQIGCFKILLKLFYIEEDYRGLDGTIEQFQSLLYRNRKRISDTVKEANLNFLKCIEQLQQKENPDCQAYKGKMPILDYHWLLKIQGSNQ